MENGTGPQDASAGGLPQRVELHPPEDVRRITRRLEEAGFGTWAVGGAVRDALVGLAPGDWDLTTAARPADVRRLFRRTVPIGIEHGTVGVLGKDGHLYEVTTFRRDVETDGRHARVVFADHLEADLDRRDFTINAVAWHPVRQEVCDPHGGRADLRAGLLRTVGEPAERFREDRLRVLRALRFAGRFDLRIERATWEAVRASAGQLHHLSAERVREELYKVLAMRGARRALHLYRESGVLQHLYPELDACAGVEDEHGTDVWEHLLDTVAAAPRHHLAVRLAALLHDAGKPRTRHDAGGAAMFPDHALAGGAIARDLLRRLKASNAEIDRVSHLVAQHQSWPAADEPLPALRRWMRTVGPEFLPDLLRLRIADHRARHGRAPAPQLLALIRRLRGALRERTPLAVGDLAIGGAELRELGIPPGPLYGEILRDLLERVIDDPELNTREQLMELVRAGLETGGEA